MYADTILLCCLPLPPIFFFFFSFPVPISSPSNGGGCSTTLSSTGGSESNDYLSRLIPGDAIAILSSNGKWKMENGPWDMDALGELKALLRDMKRYGFRLHLSVLIGVE